MARISGAQIGRAFTVNETADIECSSSCEHPLNDPETSEMSRSALVHLYRGELGRATSYRLRLDTTTNWAMSVNIAVATFTLGTEAASHVLLALPFFLTTVFALIETRRFQELSVLRKRLNLLESGLFVPILRQQEHTAHWGEALANSLEIPKFETSLLSALANRVRRNYSWLYFTIYLAWISKLSLTNGNVVEAASIGVMPGLAVIILVSVLQIPWILLIFMGRSAEWI